MVKILNFTLHVFYHNKKKVEDKRENKNKQQRLIVLYALSTTRSMYSNSKPKSNKGKAYTFIPSNTETLESVKESQKFLTSLLFIQRQECWDT